MILFFFDATKSLALDMLGTSDKLDERITHGFNRALFRNPSPEELSAMLSVFEKSLELYLEQPSDVKAITKDLNEKTPEMAAMINLAAVIFNLDEMITKG